MEEELHLRFIFWEGPSQIKSEENARETNEKGPDMRTSLASSRLRWRLF